MYFSKAIVVLSIALSALASPHVARGVNHRAVAHRAAMPIPAAEPTVVAPVKRSRKRGSNRCIARSSSSSIAPTSSSVLSSSVVSTSSSSVSSSSFVPSSSSSASPTTTHHTTTHTSSSITVPQNVESDAPTTSAAAPTTQPPATTKHTSAAQPTTSAPSAPSGNDPLGILTGTHSGDGTYYATGLGACGITNVDTDYIAAVSHTLFDNYPGYTGGNPNNNPVCGKKLTAFYQGKSVTVTVTDRCVGCAIFDLDFSPSAFNQLAAFAIGRFQLTWNWD